MNQLFLNKDEINVPGTWDELEPSQTLHLVPLIQVRKPDLGTKMRALLILLKAKNNISLVRKLNKMSDEDRYDCLALTEFIWEKRPSYTVQKFPRIGDLYGPGDRFNHLVFFEFIKSEKYYLEFSKKQDQELLDKMIACLWRPADPAKTAGDRRMRFTDDTIQQRAKIISKWPLRQKLAIYLWFDSCRQFIIPLYPLVFPKEKNAVFNPGRRTKGWIDVATTLAENVTNVDGVLYSELTVVLLYLNNKIEENEEFERKNKKK